MGKRKAVPFIVEQQEREPREETILHGHHPEIASIYSSGYDPRDPYLTPESERQDYEYVSPRDRQYRNKYKDNC